jgi:transcriptional regulator with XRE-family HTH domain
MNNLEKLNKALSKEKSTWEAEARWRAANEDWLSVSFDIAVRVLDTLQAKGMTQKELADKMGVSPQFVNKVVKGQENLSLETIAKLSRALGVSLIEVANEKKAPDFVFGVERSVLIRGILPGVGLGTIEGSLELTRSSVLFKDTSIVNAQNFFSVNEQRERYRKLA